MLETLEGRTLLSTYTVTNTSDSGAGSLRQAILDANNHGGSDTIAFAIGSGAQTISSNSHLPGLNDGTSIDATTPPSVPSGASHSTYCAENTLSNATKPATAAAHATRKLSRRRA